MPQINQSAKMGKSTSPLVNSAIQNSQYGQAPVAVPGGIKNQHNKQPVKVKQGFSAQGSEAQALALKHYETTY